MSARRSTGVLLIASGSIGTFVGFLLSVTGIGALCGVPLILVCIPMTIWGYLMKAKHQALKDEELTERMLHTQAVASGVNICHRCKAPNHMSNPSCATCGFDFMPAGNPRPISAVDPTEVALRSKQMKDKKNFGDPMFEDEF